MSERTLALLTEVLDLPLEERKHFADKVDASIDSEIDHSHSEQLSLTEEDEALHKLILERIEEAERNPDNFIDGETFKREFLAHMARVKP